VNDARPVRVVLADDHTLVRAGVRKILEAHPEFHVVAEAQDGASALEALRAADADVLVLDLSMPGADGFAVLARAKLDHPDLKVLVLTMHTDAEYVARAIDGGADGYLLKDSAVQDLVAAIGAVMAGGVYHSPEAQRALSEVVRRRGGEAVRPIDLLTDREREVLKLVAEGLATKEIASRLEISTRTVESHRANLMRKLDVRSVALLTQLAIKEGLLGAP
jgi:DNA-binding NarL/FixJ family response regulator